MTLITSTTENPHFYIYNAIISRSSLFEFKPVPPKDGARALARTLEYLNRENNAAKHAENEVLEYIAGICGGDVRRAINVFENAYFASESEEITREAVDIFNAGVSNYDEDTHFDLLSCLQKSIRGSDPDAAVFYLAKLLSLGELISVCRRLQVIASEDIGLAYPLASAVCRALCESAKELGMPEARIPLANATVMLATAPKSNSAYLAYEAAAADVEKGLGRNIPVHLQSPLYKGYRYPHDFPGHYVRQRSAAGPEGQEILYLWGQQDRKEAARLYFEKIKTENEELLKI